MKPFTIIAAVIFGLMALYHAYRVAIGIPVNVGTAVITPALSWVGLVIAGAMSFGLFREARR